MASKKNFWLFGGNLFNPLETMMICVIMLLKAKIFKVEGY